LETRCVRWLEGYATVRRSVNKELRVYFPEAAAADGTEERVRRALSWQEVTLLGLLHRWTIRMVARADLLMADQEDD
jgi:hypothetical protein